MILTGDNGASFGAITAGLICGFILGSIWAFNIVAMVRKIRNYRFSEIGNKGGR